ncbi:MAG: endolytic transglycosylase MltG [Clostridia bacterium]|nr:endolytic transglycosylase MltG [Clostridia bacterium]
MDNSKLRKYYKIMIPLIFVLLIVFVTLVAVTFKKERDRRNAQALEAQSRALAEKIVTVMFPEGYTVTQMAQKLEENGVVSKDRFLQYVKNPPESLLEKLQLDDVSDKIFALEGYLMPDTYEFYKDEEPETVVDKFISNFLNKVSDKYDIYKASKAGSAKEAYSLDEIITAASIIQKESGLSAENAKVASVIFNRLGSSMQLQCDVTGNYLEKYVKPFVDDYSETYENNYDTFKCAALPAGAICNPGLEAIEAAMSPAQTDYLFFVTDSKDTSIFYYAVTYSEHLANCRTAGYTGY